MHSSIGLSIQSIFSSLLEFQSARVLDAVVSRPKCASLNTLVTVKLDTTISLYKKHFGTE